MYFHKEINTFLDLTNTVSTILYKNMLSVIMQTIDIKVKIWFIYVHYETAFKYLISYSSYINIIHTFLTICNRFDCKKTLTRKTFTFPSVAYNNSETKIYCLYLSSLIYWIKQHLIVRSLKAISQPLIS